MFNRRESTPNDNDTGGNPQSGGESEAGTAQAAASGQRVGHSPPRSPERREAAVIGPSIQIDGDLRGDEDLIIEGKVKGTVHLKNNNVTIGSKGRIAADIYAHSIEVEGTMKGDLYAFERVSIRKTAQIQGNIYSPRVSLEDGARYKGSIEMDPEAEVLKTAFSNARGNTGSKPAVSGAPPVKPADAATPARATPAESGKPRAPGAATG